MLTLGTVTLLLKLVVLTLALKIIGHETLSANVEDVTVPLQTIGHLLFESISVF